MYYDKTKFRPIQDTMLTIAQQQCIFAMCKNFCTVFTKEEKIRFHRLCLQIAGSHKDALFDYLVTSHGLKDVSNEFGVSIRSLQYYRNEFYNNFEFVHRI